MSYYPELLYDLLEPYAVKVARTVLRGEGISNNPDLPDNTKFSGQGILSTIGNIDQPTSKKFKTFAKLPSIIEEYGTAMQTSEEQDDTPSCSLAESLAKQDLFINSTIAHLGASLLWNLLKDGMTENRGFFLNLQNFKSQPITVGS